MEQLNIAQKILVWGIPILFAITVHEAAHGYVARIFGDYTAQKLGRVTMNPIKHIDLMGTIVIPLVMLISTNFIFGWAKPVPVNPNNLKNPKKHMAIVAAAGPLSNLLMAILWVFLLKMSVWLVQNDFRSGIPFIYMGQAGILINLVLMVLNLLPIPPLDGSKILMAFLPTRINEYLNRNSLIGLLLIVGLLVTGVLAKIMLPIIAILQKYLFLFFNV